MAVQVELRNERGDVISPPVVSLEEADLPNRESRDFPYLSLIDPYGDTIFNRRQMLAVIPEIQLLLSVHPSPEWAVILSLARQCADEVHTYLCFVGD